MNQDGNRKPSVQLASLIQKEILPSLNVGDKLPTERALSQQYDVSRTVVREALMILSVHGIIETKRGSGSVLIDRKDGALHDSSEEMGPFEIIQARMILECAIVRFAAKVATPTDIRELSKIQANHQHYLYDEFDIDKISYYDTQFHLKIAEATHNMAIIQTEKSIRSYSGKSASWEAFQKMFENDPEQLELSYKEHQAILSAISNRNSEKAARHMFEHMQRKIKNLKEDCKATNVQMDDAMFDNPMIY